MSTCSRDAHGCLPARMNTRRSGSAASLANAGKCDPSSSARGPLSAVEQGGGAMGRLRATRVARPRDRVQRTAPAPPASGVRRLLQRRSDSPWNQQGSATATVRLEEASLRLPRRGAPGVRRPPSSLRLAVCGLTVYFAREVWQCRERIGCVFWPLLVTIPRSSSDEAAHWVTRSAHAARPRRQWRCCIRHIPRSALILTRDSRTSSRGDRVVRSADPTWSQSR